ncbi:MAG: putative glycosyltransferase [Armatimonadetes bacterium]|nr:putative glycosyltransferase [Armatimonadota bacterium]
MDVTIVIPTYGRPDALLQTLEALLRLDYPRDRWEAVVVDDGSPSDIQAPVQEWIERTGAPVRLFRQMNAGPAAARNRGAAEARGKYLIFIDNDVLVQPDFLRLHLTALEANPNTWIGGRVLQPRELQQTPFGRYRDRQHERFHQSFQSDQLQETVWVTTQNLALPRQDFEELGGFDQSFTIASSEDWELGFRARNSGTRILYHPGITVLHNDWAIDLPRFCERQRLYSYSDVLLWRKYGDSIARAPMIRENSPVAWGTDPPRLVAKKVAKRVFSGAIGRAALLSWCRLTELVAPDSSLNRRAYDLAVGAAIYHGVRGGLRRYPAIDSQVAGNGIGPAPPGFRPKSSDATSQVVASVVIPTHNRSSLIDATLTELAKVRRDPALWEVVVVDDGSSDDTEAVIRRWTETAPFRVQYLKQANAGPAAARNRGAAAARGEVLIFLDDDIEVQPDFVDQHVRAVVANKGCWITGRILHPPELRKTPFGEYRNAVWERFHEQQLPGRLSDSPGGSAANLSLPAEDFRQLGGFDESFTTPSSEDWDLTLRARQQGVRVLYHPGIRTLHSDWASVSLEQFCERQRIYSIADALLWRKYGDASPRRTVIWRNAPVSWGREPAGLVLRKGAKALLATPPGRWLLRQLCSAAERSAPRSSFNWWAYDIAVAVAIYRGVREGLRRYQERPPAARTAALEA